MQIRVKLEHPMTNHQLTYVIHAVDPGGIAKVMQEGGPSKLNKLVSGLITQKIPTTLYPYDVKGWEFVDAPLEQQEAAA